MKFQFWVEFVKMRSVASAVLFLVFVSFYLTFVKGQSPNLAVAADTESSNSINPETQLTNEQWQQVNGRELKFNNFILWFF